MQKLIRLAHLAAAVALCGAALSAHADLVAQSDGTVYDTVLNISWMSNWNLAGETMTYSQTQAWIISLNAENYEGHNDWMLPTTLQPDPSCQYQAGASSGSGCTGSPMGELFYNELGATAGHSILSGTNTAGLALFTNMQSSYYWSGTKYAPSPSDVWDFGNANGTVGIFFQGSGIYAVAVRPGADEATAVPEPEALALVLLGLGAAALARRRAR